VPILHFEVVAARKVAAVRHSYQGMSMGHGIAPSGVNGYGERPPSTIRRWSFTQMLSAPASSASRPIFVRPISRGLALLLGICTPIFMEIPQCRPPADYFR
jgi:hypothetical protein